MAKPRNTAAKPATPPSTPPAHPQGKSLYRIFGQLIGHELAATLALCALTIVSCMPVLLLRALAYIGLKELEPFIAPFEKGVFFLGFGLFGLVYLTGFWIFVAELVVWVKVQQKHIFSEDKGN